ncbi:MAG: hypothetical protein RIR16_892 [Actinomycetota bacterium]|jgi:cytochrome bd-type quinol oxidase subunit 2
MANTPNRLGVGRLLVAVYAVFAVSSTARASYQVLTKFEEAPLAYSLSLLAAVVYIIATVALARRGNQNSKTAWFAVGFELVGVLVVGLLSILSPELFAHPAVWSNFGQGYGFIPLILPLLGLYWLKKQGAR